MCCTSIQVSRRIGIRYLYYYCYSGSNSLILLVFQNLLYLQQICTTYHTIYNKTHCKKQTKCLGKMVTGNVTQQPRKSNLVRAHGTLLVQLINLYVCCLYSMPIPCADKEERRRLIHSFFMTTDNNEGCYSIHKVQHKCVKVRLSYVA